MTMVNIDLAFIPAAVSQAIRACESCEVLRKPRVWICEYHDGYWTGYDQAQQDGRHTDRSTDV